MYRCEGSRVGSARAARASVLARLCEGDELVDAGRDGVEHVCKVGEVEASAARAAHHAAQQRPAKARAIARQLGPRARSLA
eukprot:26104-Pleurochrysis_carterae.AAC.1